MRRLLRWAFCVLGMASSSAQGIQAVSQPTSTVKVSTSVTPATYAGRQLMVGNGGGFTGGSKTYYLFENGQLFVKNKRDSTYTALPRQTKTATQRAFATAEQTCRVKTTRYHNPGNVYKFVGWKKGRQQNTVTWGGSGKAVAAAYPKFYTMFMAMVARSVN